MAGWGSGTVSVLGPYHFAFNSTNIGANSAFALWTPSVGDVILDAFVEVSTIFNCNTPTLDLGFFQSSEGNFATGGPFLTSAKLSLGANAVATGTVVARKVGATPLPGSLLSSSVDFGGTAVNRFVPVRVLVATPVCAHITDTTGGTTGQADVYFVVAR